MAFSTSIWPTLKNALWAAVIIVCAFGLDKLEHYMEAESASHWLVEGVRFLAIFLFAMDGLFRCFVEVRVPASNL